MVNVNGVLSKFRNDPKGVFNSPIHGSPPVTLEGSMGVRNHSVSEYLIGAFTVFSLR
jgi:hypothetical protein